jgi:hypothetical protein
LPTTEYLKNSWRWVVCGLDGTTKTILDKIATNVSVQYVLDDTSQMTCDVPSDELRVYRHGNDGEPLVSYLRRILYGFRREEPDGGQPWVCRYGGIITINQDQATTDEPVTHLTANDPWTWLKGLPVLMPDGSLPPQKGVTYTNKRGNYIVLDVIANAYAWMNATPSFKTGGNWKWTAFGNGHSNLFIDIASGTFENTDVIPSISFQQGASVYDAWTQLCQTGGLDIVLTPYYHPRDSPGVVSQLNVYNQAGDNQPGVVFGWDMFPRNVAALDDLLDGTQVVNWAQFFAGGGVATNPSGSGDPYHAQSDASIDDYGPYWALNNLAGPSEGAAVGLLSLAEVKLRNRGKQTLTIDATPERAPDPFTRYYLGDTVAVWGGRDLAPQSGPLSANNGYGSALRHAVRSLTEPTNHRVYGFQVDLADDLTETITNILLTDPNPSL